MSILYVAYGSNLNKEQMAYRCPTAVPYGTGFLNNWKLLYRGHPNIAYATIERRKGCKVPVALWELKENDLRSLDVYEGYPTFYYRQNVMVELPTGRKKAIVYIMDPCQKPELPHHRYINQIRKGYVDFGLDMKYLDNSLTYNKKECDL